MYIYIYIYVCIYIFIYTYIVFIYIHIHLNRVDRAGRVARANTRGEEHAVGGEQQTRRADASDGDAAAAAAKVGVSLYKILFYFTAVLWSISSFYCHHPTRNAYHIAVLLHAHCAIYAPPPTLPLYAIHHTILMMAISW